MKKQLFTLALLATIAVGGAFASMAADKTRSTNVGSPLNPNGACSTPQPLAQPDCDPDYTGDPCTILSSGVQAFTEDPNSGNCTLQLKRP